MVFISYENLALYDRKIKDFVTEKVDNKYLDLSKLSFELVSEHEVRMYYDDVLLNTFDTAKEELLYDLSRKYNHIKNNMIEINDQTKSEEETWSSKKIADEIEESIANLDLSQLDIVPTKINGTYGDVTIGSVNDEIIVDTDTETNRITLKYAGVTNEDIEKLMKTENYVDKNNIGYVKKAITARELECMDGMSPFSYVGTNKNGDVGVFPLPSGISGNNSNYQAIFNNVKANTTYSFDMGEDDDKDDKIVQVYEKLDGAKNVQGALYDFSNSKNNFICSDDVSDKDGLSIRTEYSYNVTLNSDGLYETEIIDKDSFIEIYGIEGEI